MVAVTFSSVGKGQQVQGHHPQLQDPGNSKLFGPWTGETQKQGTLTPGLGTRVWPHHLHSSPWKAQSRGYPGQSQFSASVFGSTGTLRVITRRKISSFFCGSYRKKTKLSSKKQATPTARTVATAASPPSNSQHAGVSAYLVLIAAHESCSCSILMMWKQAKQGKRWRGV